MEKLSILIIKPIFVKIYIKDTHDLDLVHDRCLAGRETRMERAGCLHTLWCLYAPAWAHTLKAHPYSCPCILHHSHFRKTHIWRDAWNIKKCIILNRPKSIFIHGFSWCLSCLNNTEIPTGKPSYIIQNTLTLFSGWAECFLLRWGSHHLGSSQRSIAGRCACSCAGSPPGRHIDSTRSPGTEGLVGGRRKSKFGIYQTKTLIAH